jgi:hypothetical protein
MTVENAADLYQVKNTIDYVLAEAENATTAQELNSVCVAVRQSRKTLQVLEDALYSRLDAAFRREGL